MEGSDSLAIKSTNPPSQSEFEIPRSTSDTTVEVDVNVTRVGSLGVRLRYHRLLLTPYLSAWEESNHPQPGPFREAVNALVDPPFVPEVGDALVAVNGESLLGLPLEGAVEVIRASATTGAPRILRLRRTTQFERDHVDGKQSVLEGTSTEPWIAGMSRLDSFNMALGGSDGVVDDMTLRSLAAGGCPEETGARGMVWRYLLDQLPPKRSDWATHLERERSLYKSFSADMFNPNNSRNPNLQAAASLANEEMYDDPPKPPKDDKVPVSEQQGDKEEDASENHGEAMKLGEEENIVKEELRDKEEAAGEGTGVIDNDEIKAKEGDTDKDEVKGKEGDTDKDEIKAKGGDTDKDEIKAKEGDTDEDEFLLYEISKDVVRTHPDLQFFLDAKHGPARYESLKRVLFVYAKLNPGVKYVQGMNELLGALFYVLAAQSPQPAESPELAHLFSPEDAEADSFNCFTVLMGELRDVFVEDLDDSTTGIKGRMLAIDTLLGYHDQELHRVLTQLGVDPTFYTLRWITTLLSREFDLPDTLRLWDAFLSEKGMRNREIWLAYFCVAMVIGIREELLVADFGGAINLLQAYPPSAPSIENLLDSASALRRQDESGNSRASSWPWPSSRTISDSMTSERWSAAARPLMTDLRAKASQSAAALAAKAGGSASVMADSVGAARNWWSSRKTTPSMSIDSNSSAPTSPTCSSTGSEANLNIEGLSLQCDDELDEQKNQTEGDNHNNSGIDGPSLITALDTRSKTESDDEFEDIPLPSPGGGRKNY